MKLAIFNGSPKREKSNTENLLKSFIEGFLKNKKNKFEMHYLYGASPFVNEKKAFLCSEYALIAFPLYLASMPGCVKDFIEEIGNFDKANNSYIGYFVQFAFLEAAHARPLERYLKKMTFRLKRNYLGTILMGRCDGIDRGTAYFNKKCFKGMHLIGKKFGDEHKFDQKLLAAYAQPERNTVLFNSITKRIIVFYLNKFHWDVFLKRRHG